MTGTFLLAVCLLANPSTPAPEGSYLYYPVTGPDCRTRARVELYIPHEGDLVLFDDDCWYWHILYRFPAMTEPPDHSGIVVLKPDGTPALLESGPDDSDYVLIQDAIPRLNAFKGTIWIRRLKKPLDPEHSARLTNFALAQEGKKYAIWRLLLQGTPFRCRGKYSGKWRGKTYMNRNRWLCSELVITAGTHAGLFDPKIHKANILYPRDIIDNHVFDFSDTWEDPGVWSSCPPIEK
jgi:hypothetical protein